MSAWHLAQMNIAQAREAMDHEVMAGFVARLDEVNALAESSPGFIWRLKDDSGNATDIRAFPDPTMLVNLSVWKDAQSLREYVYKGAHTDVMRQRKQWFHRMPQMYYVMWWVPAGHIPSVEEGKARLELLRAHGEGPDGFTFANLHPAPEAAPVEP